jgi:hypothetical protein
MGRANSRPFFLDAFSGLATLVPGVSLLARESRGIMAAEKRHAHCCPVCGEPVFRIRREWRHRIVSPFWPSKRYECHNPACRWSGLLYSDQMAQRRKEKIAVYGGTLAMAALAGILLLLLLGFLGLLLYRHLFG